MIGFGTATNVTEAQWKEVQDRIVVTRKEFIARKIISPTGPVGLGVRQFAYNSLTEMSGAELDYDFVQQKDMVAIAESTANVHIIQKDFHISELNLLSSQRSGIPLDLTLADAAAYQVNVTEETTVLVGNTTPTISGLYNGAGNDYSTTKGFDTPGNPTAAVQGAQALLRTDSIHGPFHLVLHPDQYSELEGSIFTGGIDEFKKVKSLIGGEVFWSDSVATTTGMLVEADATARGHIEYRLAADTTLNTDSIEIASGGGINGKVYVASRLLLKDSNAVCKLSDI